MQESVNAASQAPLPVNVVTRNRERSERMGRIHRAFGSGGVRGHPAARVRLHHRDPFRGRRDHQERRSALRDRSASLPGGFRSRRSRARADAGAAETCANRTRPGQGSARQEYDLGRASSTRKPPPIRAAAAAARSAEAAKNSAALNLEFTQIKSPIDGRVSDARITVGNLVQPGAGPESVLTTVVSVDPIYAQVDADENAVLKYVKLSDEGKRVSARTAKDPGVGRAWERNGFSARRLHRLRR